MFQYTPFNETLSNSDIGEYETWGIKVVDSNGVLIEMISDISIDRKVVIDLCKQMTEYDLDVDHLRDIIYDFIL